MSSTYLKILQRVREVMQDGYREILTTNLTTSTAVVSTNFNKWDGGLDDYFNDWFVYIEDKENAGAYRVLSDYATSGGSCTARGSNFSADSAAATVMLTKMNPANYLVAIQRAVRQIYPVLFVSLEDRTLITNNWLPNSSFEDQSTSGTPDFYTHSSTTGTKTTTAGLYRGALGTTSIKLVAGVANDYMYITSKNFPRLLDLMGKTVTLKSWVYPEVADDGYIVIYTIQADGTEQTLTSSTSCPATKLTLLELEDQTLNDNLVEIQIRFKIATNTKYAYFDTSRLHGPLMTEYLLPKDFRDGHLSQVYRQIGSSQGDPCDDLHMGSRIQLHNSEVVSDGTYKWLRLDDPQPSNQIIQLIGYKPLETLTDIDDTISVDDPQLDLVIAQACVELFTLERGMASPPDRDSYDIRKREWQDEVRRLKYQFAMPKPIVTASYRK